MNELLKEVKEAGQDFEWYPTTQEIISKIAGDLNHHSHQTKSLMDIGAGDGRVLLALNKSLENRTGRTLKLLAIEKSQPLISQMDRKIGFAGTDLFEQNLIDKKVDFIFCNPPYSEYETWVEKIINEASAKYIYLAIPTRWKNNDKLTSLIEKKGFSFSSLGEFDFLQAERKARAVVDIVKIKTRHYGGSQNEAFQRWFNDEFMPDSDLSSSYSSHSTDQKIKTEVRAKVSELVNGSNLVEALVELYQKELNDLLSAYKQIKGINPLIFKHLDINQSTLSDTLSIQIDGLKSFFWGELFDNYSLITNRLTSQKKDSLTSFLNGSVNVDFTMNNAYSITLWAIKHANSFYDEQLVEVFEGLLTTSNLVKYKSNTRTFGEENWRYRSEGYGDNIGLDYRIIVSRYSAIEVSNRAFTRSLNGLSQSAFDLINDLGVVAENLGYQMLDSARTFEWEAGKPQLIKARLNGSEITLMRVKAFHNGNLHFQFDKSFIKRLNIEFGKLKGWLKSKEQAKEELDLTDKDLLNWDESCFKLSPQNVIKLIKKQ